MRLARFVMLSMALLLVPVLAGCATEPATWTYAPAPSKTPAASADASAAASEVASSNVQISASGIKFEQTDVAVPAGGAFKIDFDNKDPSTPHNVVIHQGDANGAVVFTGDTVTGVAIKTYDVPSLTAGAYVFVCTIHPGMQGNMTAG